MAGVEGDEFDGVGDFCAVDGDAAFIIFVDMVLLIYGISLYTVNIMSMRSSVRPEKYPFIKRELQDYGATSIDDLPKAFKEQVDDLHAVSRLLEDSRPRKPDAFREFVAIEDKIERLKFLAGLNLYDAIKCVAEMGASHRIYLDKRLRRFAENIRYEKKEDHNVDVSSSSPNAFGYVVIPREEDDELRLYPDALRKSLLRDVLYAAMIGTPELAAYKIAKKRIENQGKSTTHLLQLKGYFSFINEEGIGDHYELLHRLYEDALRIVTRNNSEFDDNPTRLEREAVNMAARWLEIASTFNDPSRSPTSSRSIDAVTALAWARLDSDVRHIIKGMFHSRGGIALGNLSRFVGKSGNRNIGYEKKLRRVRRDLWEFNLAEDVDSELKETILRHLDKRFFEDTLTEVLKESRESEHNAHDTAVSVAFMRYREQLKDEERALQDKIKNKSLARQALELQKHFDDFIKQNPDKEYMRLVRWFADAPFGVIRRSYRALERGVSEESIVKLALAEMYGDSDKGLSRDSLSDENLILHGMKGGGFRSLIDRIAAHPNEDFRERCFVEEMKRAGANAFFDLPRINLSSHDEIVKRYLGDHARLGFDSYLLRDEVMSSLHIEKDTAISVFNFYIQSPQYYRLLTPWITKFGLTATDLGLYSKTYKDDFARELLSDLEQDSPLARSCANILRWDINDSIGKKLNVLINLPSLEGLARFVGQRFGSLKELEGKVSARDIWRTGFEIASEHLWQAEERQWFGSLIEVIGSRDAAYRYLEIARQIGADMYSRPLSIHDALFFIPHLVDNFPGEYGENLKNILLSVSSSDDIRSLSKNANSYSGQRALEFGPVPSDIPSFLRSCILIKRNFRMPKNISEVARQKIERVLASVQNTTALADDLSRSRSNVLSMLDNELGWDEKALIPPTAEITRRITSLGPILSGILDRKNISKLHQVIGKMQDKKTGPKSNTPSVTKRSIVFRRFSLAG